jgi:AcrR family transcriptional regulator
MPYTAEHKQATRKRILESARRLFNAKGFAQVSIDEVMEQAGLTRGGFYRHFRDKSQLYAEAVRWFLCAEAPKPWQQKMSRSARAKNRSQRIVDAYFSLDHFSDRETCCPLLTLPADVGGDEVRSAYGDVLSTLIVLFEADLGDRDAALSLAALCVRRHDPGAQRRRSTARPRAAQRGLSASAKHVKGMLQV